MKQLYLVAGTMGVGKTTVCQALKQTLPNSVFFRRRLVLGYAPFSGNQRDPGDGAEKHLLFTEQFSWLLCF